MNLNNKTWGIIIGLLIVGIVVLGAYNYYYINKYSQPIKIKKIITTSGTNKFFSASESKMYNNNDLDSLIDELQAKLKKNPDNQNTLLGLGMAYLQKSNLEYNGEIVAPKGRVYIEKVLNKDPSNPQAIALLAYSYEVEMNYDKAIEEYQKAIQLDPRNAYLYNRLGHVYDLEGKNILAIENYKKALLLNDKSGEAYANMARMYTRVGQFQTAISYYKKALEYVSNKQIKSGIYSSLGSIYSNLGRTNKNEQQAEKYLNLAIQINPKNALAYANLEEEYFLRVGELNRKKESQKDKVNDFKLDLKKIEEYLNKSIRINPNQTVAYKWGALALASIGRFPEAIKVINSGIRAVNNDNTLFGKKKQQNLAFFYMMKSVIYAQNPEINGNVKYSLKYFKKALATDKTLLNSFVYPEIKKGRNGYFYKIQNNPQFKQILKEY